MTSLYTLYTGPEFDLAHKRLPRPGLFKTLLAASRDWNNRRKAVRELYAMPDRLLRDLGIDRAQIPYVVSGLARTRRQSSRPGAVIKSRLAA